MSLKKRSEFLDLKEKEVFFSPFFILQKDLSQDLKDLHFGIVASKKVGNSVERNRAKRRIRALFRDLHLQDFCPTGRVVMIAKKTLIKAPFPELRKLLLKGIKNVQKSSLSSS